MRVLKAVAGGPLAWSTPREVAEALGDGVEQTTDTLASLNVAGWVDVWEREEGLVVTLSALAAERLGLRLVEYGRLELPRWVSLNDHEPYPMRARRVLSGTRSAELEFLFDPYPSPDEAAEAAEAIASDGKLDRRPTLIVGQGLTPWPGPEEGRDRSCPACGDAYLPTHAYCLHCDRSGRDLPETADVGNGCGGCPGRRRAMASGTNARRHRAGLCRRKARRRARLQTLANGGRAASRTQTKD